MPQREHVQWDQSPVCHRGSKRAREQDDRAPWDPYTLQPIRQLETVDQLMLREQMSRPPYQYVTATDDRLAIQYSKLPPHVFRRQCSSVPEHVACLTGHEQVIDALLQTHRRLYDLMPHSLDALSQTDLSEAMIYAHQTSMDELGNLGLTPSPGWYTDIEDDLRDCRTHAEAWLRKLNEAWRTRMNALTGDSVDADAKWHERMFREREGVTKLLSTYDALEHCFNIRRHYSPREPKNLVPAILIDGLIRNHRDVCNRKRWTFDDNSDWIGYLGSLLVRQSYDINSVRLAYKRFEGAPVSPAELALQMIEYSEAGKSRGDIGRSMSRTHRPHGRPLIDLRRVYNVIQRISMFDIDKHSMVVRSSGDEKLIHKYFPFENADELILEYGVGNGMSMSKYPFANVEAATDGDGYKLTRNVAFRQDVGPTPPPTPY